MRSDEEIEAYLDAVSSYESEKLEASAAWKSAFINLAKARLSCEVSYSMHDPRMPASTVFKDKLETTRTSSLMGAWPPRSLQDARDSFLSALQHEIAAHNAESRTNVV